MTLILYIALLAWISFTIWVWLMQYSVQKVSLKKTNSLQKLSVVIIGRNEGKNINPLMEALLAQTLPQEFFKIYYFDDHSNDDSLSTLQVYINKLPLNIISLGEIQGQSAKKTAITQAVEIADSEYLIITDADCIPQPGWLESFSQAISQYEIDMICGTVVMQNQGDLFTTLQQTEFATLVSSAIAFNRSGNPLMCNAANLCFSKTAFKEVNGYEGLFHIPGGDDEFLMYRFHQAGKRIYWHQNAAATVYTKAVETAQAFIQQRLRWASKFKHYQGAMPKISAMGVALMQGLILASIITAFNEGDTLLLVLLSLKVITEYLLIITFFNQSGSNINYLSQLISVLIWQWLYPVYSLGIGLASVLGIQYQWKDRRY